VADEEDVTDLTDESGGKDKKKKGKAPKAPKAEKPAKAPKAPKAPKEKKSKEPKVKGEKRSGLGGLLVVMLLILLILAGGSFAVLYFDYFDAREIISEFVQEPLIEAIVWLDPGFSSINDSLNNTAAAHDKRLAEIEEMEAEMEVRDGELNARGEALNSREQQLDRRAMDLERHEEAIRELYERMLPLHKRDMTPQEMDDMMSLSRIYTNMAPGVAAGILVELHDPMDVAAILYYMGERNSAAILAEMDTEFAAELTEIWLYY
jgi:flagellar motility protein MotE (MotC chaperone)